MARRRKSREDDRLEALLKAILGIICLAALGLGGIHNFVPALFGILITILCLAAAGFIGWLSYRFYRARKENVESSSAKHSNPLSTTPSVPVYQHSEPEPATVWTTQRIKDSLGEIDWYQFEKFCAALLHAEGYRVERKGGAQPDGGVDLICAKGGDTILVQCKHWRTWTVQEKTIRELLGSMTHFQAKRGALYTLKGWTRPSAEFATQHGITLVEAAELAQRARAAFSDRELEALLSSREHHCPKCESRMIWRTGDFTPFWGCSTFPRCRGILKQSGAR